MLEYTERCNLQCVLLFSPVIIFFNLTKKKYFLEVLDISFSAESDRDAVTTVLKTLKNSTNTFKYETYAFNLL